MKGGFGSAPFAELGPLLLEATAPDGRWLSVCQARKDSDRNGKLAVDFGATGEPRGDAFERFLITASEELAIDGWLAASPDGRYALVLQHGALVLWDSQSGRTLNLSELGADGRLSAESFDELRTVSFDASSERLLYVRTGESGPRVVLRDLRDDSERALDPGPGSIWRAQFSDSGTFAVLQMMTQDSNRNGRVDFPAPLLTGPRACAARPGHFHTYGPRGDRPETVLLPLDGAPVIHDPDLLMPIAESVLLRDASGALLLAREGRKRELANSACQGHVVHADARRELFIIGCAQPKRSGHMSLELVTRKAHRPLGIELSSVELDREVSDSPRLVALYPGSETVLFDADREALLSLQPGDVVVSTRAALALVRRGKSLLFYDADTQTEQLLPVAVDKYPDVFESAPFVFVSPLLVDLETARLVGVSEQRPLALSNQGQLLLTDGPAASSGLVLGALRWVSPS